LGTTYDTSLDIYIQCQIGAWCNFLNQAVIDRTTTPYGKLENFMKMADSLRYGKVCGGPYGVKGTFK